MDIIKNVLQVQGLLPQSFLLSLGMVGLNFCFAAIHRYYLTFSLLPKKKYYRRYNPSSKQWVDSVAAAQNNEFKGLAVLAIVVMGIGYLVDRFTWSVALLLVFLSLSLYTFLAGLYRPDYILTEEGLFVLNWFPPYMNRNMGFYPWSRFDNMETRESIIFLGAGSKIFSLVCPERDFAEMRRYIRRHLNRTGD
ncbi:MAG: hypothetical protein ACOX8W_02315 [bacterium]